MYPTCQQMSLNVQDPSTMIPTQNGGGNSQADFVLFNTKRLQSDLEAIGNKIKHHNDSLIYLQSQKSKLNESILDLQDVMSENYVSNLQGDDVVWHQNSAAGVLAALESHHGLLTKGVVGIVAKLGKVKDDNLNQVLSDYLGTSSMLAIVCKNYDSVNSLAIYDNQGTIDRNAGLHGLGSSIGIPIQGHFDAICLDNLRPYVGQHIPHDPQRRLDLLEPRLPNGEYPPGFVGFAVNMIKIDPAYLVCVTSSGYGLRETLFYSLFSRLQVYKTRVDMISALPCISHGAVSLDGGIIRKEGIFTLGSRDEEVNVRFAKPIVPRMMHKYSEMEREMRELKWKKKKTIEDIKREQVLRDHALSNFGKKKQEFVQFLAQSSSTNQPR